MVSVAIPDINAADAALMMQLGCDGGMKSTCV
jgi:pyridoxal biosynthesis lyase PdxS